MNQEKIGKFISEKRKEKNLTQQQLAEKLEVSNKSISKWENGKCLPDYSLVNDICKELDITINELFQGKDIDEESYTKEQKLTKRKRYIRKLRDYTIILLIAFLLYKGYTLLFYGKAFYKMEDTTFPKNKNISTITVENNVMYNKEFKNSGDIIRFYISEEFELVTDKAKSSLVRDRCDVYIKDLKGKNEFTSSITICDNYEDSLYNADSKIGMNNNFIYAPNKLYAKNNIEDQYDLLKYYEKHYEDKINFFTPIGKIRLLYIARNYSELSLPSYKKFYYLENDLKGYLLVMNDNHYKVSFILGNTTYELDLYNSKGTNYIDEKLVRKIINSIDRK